MRETTIFKIEVAVVAAIALSGPICFALGAPDVAIAILLCLPFLLVVFGALHLWPLVKRAAQEPRR